MSNFSPPFVSFVYLLLSTVFKVGRHPCRSRDERAGDGFIQQSLSTALDCVEKAQISLLLIALCGRA